MKKIRLVAYIIELFENRHSRNCDHRGVPKAQTVEPCIYRQPLCSHPDAALACTLRRELQHVALVRAVGIVREVSVKRGHWYRVGAAGLYGCGNNRIHSEANERIKN